MGVETIVSDVRGAVEPYVAKGQDVVTLSVDSIKQANTIVVDGVQELYKTNLTAGKDLFSAAQSSFEKVKADGVQAVATKPIAYLPEGKDVVVAAYKDSYTIVTKAGEELVSVVRKSFDDVTAKLNAKSAPKKKTAARKVAKTAKKAAAKKTA